jgi:hypothetical protein
MIHTSYGPIDAKIIKIQRKLIQAPLDGLDCGSAQVGMGQKRCNSRYADTNNFPAPTKSNGAQALTPRVQDLFRNHSY